MVDHFTKMQKERACPTGIPVARQTFSARHRKRGHAGTSLNRQIERQLHVLISPNWKCNGTSPLLLKTDANPV
jgi:hypothetical protein